MLWIDTSTDQVFFLLDEEECLWYPIANPTHMPVAVLEAILEDECD